MGALRMWSYVHIATLLWMGHAVWGFALGPPPNKCTDGYPHHEGLHAQFGPSPYNLHINQTSYSPSDTLEIRLSSPFNTPFRGVIGRALSSGERPAQLVGQFLSSPNGTTLISWYPRVNGQMNCAFHTDASLKDEVLFLWQAPATNEGDIIVRFDVVFEFNTFWVNEEVFLKSSEGSKDNNDQQGSTVSSTGPIAPQWSECGSSLACVRYPLACLDTNCVYGATFRSVNGAQDVEVTLLGGTAPYVAVGFSADQKMGEDFYVGCVESLGKAEVMHGLMPLEYVFPHKLLGNTNMTVRREDGRLTCRFTRPALIPADLSYFRGEMDLKQSYYLLFAVGEVYPGSIDWKKHHKLPLFTSSKMNIFEAESSLYLTSSRMEIKIHGALFVIAWLILAGVGMMIGRHFKDTLTWRRSESSAMLWFQVHRVLALLSVLCSVAAFVVIFAYVRAWTLIAENHAIVGIVTTVLLLLQTLMGLCRPALDSPYRYLFRAFHFNTGLVSFLLAVATILLGFSVDIIASTERKKCFILTSCCFGIYIMWYAIMLAVGRETIPGEGEMIELNSDEKRPPEKPDVSADDRGRPAKVGIVIFCVGVILVVALSVAIITILIVS